MEVQGETKERVITKTIAVREPTEKITVEKIESKAVDTRVKSVAAESETVAAPERKHRVSAAVNVLDRSDFSVGYGYRFAGPFWLEGEWRQKQKAATIGGGD